MLFLEPPLILAVWQNIDAFALTGRAFKIDIKSVIVFGAF